MKVETKINVATALAFAVFILALCASAVTADWDAVKRLVSDSAPGNYAAVSNKAMSAVQVESDPTVPAWAKEPTSPAPGNYAAVSNKAMSAVQVESDPTVPEWAKGSSKPSYTADEVGAWSGRYEVAAALALGYYGRSWLGGAAPYSLTWDSTEKRFKAKWAVGNIPTSRYMAYMSDLDGYVPATRKVNGQPLTQDVSIEGMSDNALVLTNGAVKTKSGTAVTPSEIGAASADDLAPLAEDIRSAYQYSRTVALYMTGNTNAWFAGTNYVFGADAATRAHFAWEAGMDAATVPCSMALMEIRDGVRQCVWDQRDWPTWYWSFKAAQMRSEFNASNAVLRADVNAAINSDEAHAWAKRYASTGRVNPDPSTTFIDTPSVCLSPGMSWETVATVGGCGYWTIVGNGAVIGGSGTNAVLDIKDFEGNSILQIAKGEHRLAWLSSADFVSQMTDSDGWVCFDMRADVQPTGYFSTTLDSADFVAGSDANCPAQFTWENRGGGVWRVHFLLKPGIVSDACFAKFQVEVEGKTQIRYNADTVINGGLIYNGVKIAPVIPTGAAVGSTVTWKVVQ